VPLTIILSLVSLVLAVGDIPFLGLPCPCDSQGPGSGDSFSKTLRELSQVDCLLMLSEVGPHRLDEIGFSQQQERHIYTSLSALMLQIIRMASIFGVGNKDSSWEKGFLSWNQVTSTPCESYIFESIFVEESLSCLNLYSLLTEVDL